MTKLNRQKQAGFSLIEIMVGLVIGLLATLVIMNVFSVFEEQKRTTTGNSDSQTNGAIALYNLQRDVQLAGFGLPVFDNEYSPFQCPVSGIGSPSIDHDNLASTPAINLSPVVIIDNDGANGSDTVAVHAGDTMRGGIPARMQAGGTAGNVVEVDGSLNCAVNDVALVVDPGTLNCNMTRVNAINVTAVTRITLNNPTYVAVGNSVACLGIWNEFKYAIDANNQLTRTGSLVAGVPSATAVPIVSDIVNIQAQYGVSPNPNDNKINQWVNATGAWANPIASTFNRNRIKAVRIAIVARSGLLERNNVTNACSSLTAANPTGLCAWDGSTTTSTAPAIDLSTNADWQRYRYRVYESIIPIRNIIWSRDKLG
ncbi:MAG: PilW family protein [Methylotenera sp.]|nr:PilW family protein [Methylotenera sp.]